MMNDPSKTRTAVAPSTSGVLENPFAVRDAGSVRAGAAAYDQFNDSIPRKLIFRAFLFFTGLHIAFIVSLLFLHLRG
ncbi:MAG: hypothetical protein DME18_01530 [Verrucomicrobia bacterium]|nr:MAG: hypothetical protein DME18_01530 [Verrucomicrobiota bacterium]